MGRYYQIKPLSATIIAFTDLKLEEGVAGHRSLRKSI